MFTRIISSAIVVVVALSASSARAGFIGFLGSSSTDSFNYTLRFTPEQPGELLTAGDLVTFYNVASAPAITSAVVNGADAANFTVTEQPLGITPSGMIGAPGIPAQTMENITFTYIGPTYTLTKDFSATITTNGGFTGTLVGTGASSTYIGDLGEKDSLFPVLLPQTASGGSGAPEPASLGLLSLGGLALLVRRRRI